MRPCRKRTLWHKLASCFVDLDTRGPVSRLLLMIQSQRIEKTRQPDFTCKIGPCIITIYAVSRRLPHSACGLMVCSTAGPVFAQSKICSYSCAALSQELSRSIPRSCSAWKESRWCQNVSKAVRSEAINPSTVHGVNVQPVPVPAELKKDADSLIRGHDFD